MQVSFIGASVVFRSNKMASQQCPVWFQQEIKLNAMKRGCHLITDKIEKISDLKKIKIGLCHVLSKLIWLF